MNKTHDGCLQLFHLQLAMQPMGSSFTGGLEILPQPGATSSVVELSFCVPPQVTSTGGVISLPDSGFLTSRPMSFANSATPLGGALTAWNPDTLHLPGGGPLLEIFASPHTTLFAP